MAASDPPHPHGHRHGHGHGYGHGHGHTALGSRREAGSGAGPALLRSLAVLAVTAGVQAVVAGASGSVSLLADTIHNGADALTAIPLGLAFWLGRRRPDRRYTYGYGRAEDLAGVAVVAVVALSAAVAAWEAVARLVHPRQVHELGWVALAGAAGVLGNEAAAWYRMRTGRRIGSAALVADGRHAMGDGLASLAVVAGAGAEAVGWRWGDAAVGLAISVALVWVLAQSARDVYRRLMDAVEPELGARIEELCHEAGGVREVSSLRLRWVGHDLHAAIRLTLDGDLTLAEAHEIGERVHHALLHGVERLEDVIIHLDPADPGGDAHEETAHHHAGAR